MQIVGTDAVGRKGRSLRPPREVVPVSLDAEFLTCLVHPRSEAAVGLARRAGVDDASIENAAGVVLLEAVPGQDHADAPRALFIPASLSASQRETLVAAFVEASAEHAQQPVGASAGAASSFLDRSGQNVPPEEKPVERTAWSRQHWRVRTSIRDHLSCWMRHQYRVFFLTLTSAPSSPPQRLRQDWQALRKRLARELEIDPAVIQYRGVDTTEGHGVLHFLLAVPEEVITSKRGWLIDFAWLQHAWNEIHGAFHVNIKPVKAGEGHARRLSRYLVTQYVAGQDALVRMSGSRAELALPALRRAWRALVMDHRNRYVIPSFDREAGDRMELAAIGVEHGAARALRVEWWRRYREGFTALLCRGSTHLWGDEVMLLGDRLVTL